VFSTAPSIRSHRASGTVASPGFVARAQTVAVAVTGGLVLRPVLEDRGRLTDYPYPGARRQNQTEIFSYHDEASQSIAAVSAPSAACSMLAVQQQKRLWKAGS